MLNKKMRRLMAMSLAAVSLCTTTVPAMAAEIEPRTSKDTPWNFYVPNGTVWMSLSECKPKDDRTKVYVYWATSGGISYLNTKVYGTASDGSHPVESGGAPGVSHTYLLPGLGKYSLTNMVKENGYNYAVVKVQGIGAASSISGKWSPDSVGTYTIIN